MSDATRLHLIELQERMRQRGSNGKREQAPAQVLAKWRCVVTRSRSSSVQVTCEVHAYTQDDARAQVSNRYGGSYKVISITKLLQRRSSPD